MIRKLLSFNSVLFQSSFCCWTILNRDNHRLVAKFAPNDIKPLRNISNPIFIKCISLNIKKNIMHLLLLCKSRGFDFEKQLENIQY